MVFLLEHGQAKLLWAGSISAGVERDLILQYGSGLQAGILVQGPAKTGEPNLSSAWLETVEPRTLVRWSRALEEDVSLSVDFAEQAWGENIRFLKLEESGCLLLQPDFREGTWRDQAWIRRN